MRGYKLNDFSETRDRLERTAAGTACIVCLSRLCSYSISKSRHERNWCVINCADLNGQARLVGLRRWTSIMQSLRTLQEQGPMYTTQPLSSSEGDWQTFTQVGPYWILLQACLISCKTLADNHCPNERETKMTSMIIEDWLLAYRWETKPRQRLLRLSWQCE